MSDLFPFLILLFIMIGFVTLFYDAWLEYKRRK